MMESEVIKKEMHRVYGDVYAACLYGSQVCGYATEDSDYDVLVVLEEYEPGVKYTYVEGDVEIAFLGVSRKVFEEDVKEATYGGFIADRLINPITPVLNKEFIRSSELRRKKVIVEWESTKLILKKRENAGFIDINLLFFPFKKWNKMVSIYRPYQYSIENALRKDLREKNLNALLPGFQKSIMEVDFLREVYPGWYRISPDFVKEVLKGPLPLRLDRLRMVEREIEDLVARYLTHSRAGDSDRDLIVKETISKIKREVRHIREKGFSSPLEEPEKFLLYGK
jgi:predicted nucleotidyltransferase